MKALEEGLKQLCLSARKAQGVEAASVQLQYFLLPAGGAILPQHMRHVCVLEGPEASWGCMRLDTWEPVTLDLQQPEASLEALNAQQRAGARLLLAMLSYATLRGSLLGRPAPPWRPEGQSRQCAPTRLTVRYRILPSLPTTLQLAKEALRMAVTPI